MTDILLAGILIVTILIWLQGNRYGQGVGKNYDKLVYRWRTRRRK